MTGPLMAYAADQLKARFTVHELWNAPDAAALLREVSGRVRGVAAGGGHSHVDAALFDALPKLEIVSSFGVGYDHVDAAEAGRRGLVVTNTPDVLTDEVADLAIGLLLATVRQLPQVDRYLREGKWLKGNYPLTTSLRGRKVGIVGLGRIGKAVAHRLEAFGVPVSYHGRSRQDDVAYRYYPSLVEMAADVDVLISVAPGGASTRHIINAEVLEALGRNGILVNVGRGTVVDEKALIRALQDGTILSAGLDVFEDEPRVPAELIAIEHAVLLPHVGSASVHTREAMGQLLVDNLVSWFDGKGPLTPVSETPWKKA
ncbi:2-hydroxyacid dehydrogenase [Bosea minatitlanensis]|nr:2-hydroxyacid dehydrogenase [Bosea minatitlanensis]MCT4494186.1 2-hydroxyacid dehydrogenase [Bosea minatitlanensis]